jgi:hypothetical protein
LNAQTLIKEAAKCGVRVGLNGDSLALKACAKPPADLLAKLRAHKAEIVAALRLEAGIARPEPDEAELEERKGMAMGSVPEPYLDGWARLHCQRPIAVSDKAWRQATDAAGVFLDQWGAIAAEFQWTVGDIFDVPRDEKPGGLVWFLAGETVRSIGPEHAAAQSGRIFDRLAISRWRR